MRLTPFIGTAALLLLGTLTVQAQTTTFFLRTAAGSSVPVLAEDLFSTATVSKSLSGLLQVNAVVAVDPTVTRIVMIGATGLITYIKPSANALTASIAQGWSPIYSPLGVYTFKVKRYNASGLAISVDQINITVQ